jgi:hypothetical protein
VLEHELDARAASAQDNSHPLVAEDRGTVVRYFETVELAKSWLGVS